MHIKNWSNTTASLLCAATLFAASPCSAAEAAAAEKLNPSLTLARQNVGNPVVSAVSFRSMDAFFPVDRVMPAPGAPLPSTNRDELHL